MKAIYSGHARPIYFGLLLRDGLGYIVVCLFVVGYAGPIVCIFVGGDAGLTACMLFGCDARPAARMCVGGDVDPDAGLTTAAGTIGAV
jgi:hypothetical protein